MYYGALVYITMILAWIYFIYKDTCNKNKIVRSILLGLAIYAVFDLTNMAMFSDYSNLLSIVDIGWGGSLFGLSSYVAL
jgi:uncharacterized membrane protein